MRLQYRHEFELPLNPKESLRTAMEELERRLIIDALDMYQGNRTHASEALNIKRTTLIMAMKRLAIPEHTGTGQRG